MKHERIPQLEVLAWLKTNHPDLHQSVEIDRAWIWITATLKPLHKDCTCAECAKLAVVRRSIADYGFVFARRLHPLPSGKLGTWGHSCSKPLPFKRKRGQGGTARGERRPAAASTEGDQEAEAVRLAALSFLATLP